MPLEAESLACSYGNFGRAAALYGLAPVQIALFWPASTDKPQA